MIHIQGPATEEKKYLVVSASKAVWRESPIVHFCKKEPILEASRAKALRKQREIVEQVTIIQGEWMQLLNATPNEIYCNRLYFQDH